MLLFHLFCRFLIEVAWPSFPTANCDRPAKNSHWNELNRQLTVYLMWLKLSDSWRLIPKIDGVRGVVVLHATL